MTSQARAKYGRPPPPGEVFWARADVDGAPFRGSASATSNLPSALLDEFLTRVTDVKVRMFDLAEQEEKEAYERVVDGISNQRYQLIFRSHQWHEVDGRMRMLVYIEWEEPYMVLDKDLQAPPAK